MQDWFELFVAQTQLLDGLLFPLIYGVCEASRWAKETAVTGLSLMGAFRNDWYAEAVKFVDAQNRKSHQLNPRRRNRRSKRGCNTTPTARRKALLPLAQLALGDAGAQAVADGRAQLSAAFTKSGV